MYIYVFNVYKYSFFLKYSNQEISWQHIVNFFEWDLGIKRCNPGLRLLHKLTEDHISLNPSLRMRVTLAVEGRCLCLKIEINDLFHLDSNKLMKHKYILHTSLNYLINNKIFNTHLTRISVQISLGLMMYP